MLHILISTMVLKNMTRLEIEMVGPVTQWQRCRNRIRRLHLKEGRVKIGKLVKYVDMWTGTMGTDRRQPIIPCPRLSTT